MNEKLTERREVWRRQGRVWEVVRMSDLAAGDVFAFGDDRGRWFVAAGPPRKSGTVGDSSWSIAARVMKGA